jgi:hypothetical protein
MKQFLPLLIIAFALLLYIFFWCGLMIAIGRFGGWIRLAQRFHATAPFDGPKWYFQHAQLRWSCNYSGAVTVGADGRGLHMAMLFPFRPGHPTLFIPWAETKIEMKQSFWRGRYMEITFPNVPRTVVRFGQKLAGRIAAAAGPELISAGAGE